MSKKRSFYQSTIIDNKQFKSSSVTYNYKNQARSSSFNPRRKYCKRCERYGNHTESLCNEPVIQYCCYCGLNHPMASVRCNRKICENCFEYHDGIPCKKSLKKDAFCHICQMIGHSDEFCTNNWRFFHSVTKPNDFSQIKVPKFRYINRLCVTCESDQHTPFSCPLNRGIASHCNPTPRTKYVNRFKLKIIEQTNDFKKQENDDEDSDSTIVVSDESFEKESSSQTTQLCAGNFRIRRNMLRKKLMKKALKQLRSKRFDSKKNIKYKTKKKK